MAIDVPESNPLLQQVKSLTLLAARTVKLAALDLLFTGI